MFCTKVRTCAFNLRLKGGKVYEFVTCIQYSATARTGDVSLAVDVRKADDHRDDHRPENQADALFGNEMVLSSIFAGRNRLQELLHGVRLIVRGRDTSVHQPPVQVHLPVEAVDEGKVRLRGKVDAKGWGGGKRRRGKGR